MPATRIPRFAFAVRARVLVTAASVIALAACSSPTDAGRTLAGTWDLVRFTESGVTGTMTGTAVFRGDRTFSVDGTVTYPGEPTDPLVMSGTYREENGTLEMTISGESITWSMTFSGGDLLLVSLDNPPGNELLLRNHR